jgi:hypothetical protein
MPICCVFFDREFSPACQVFHVAGAGALSASVQQRVEERYCQRGTFISCPLYQRVEHFLSRAEARQQSLRAWATESVAGDPPGAI